MGGCYAVMETGSWMTEVVGVPTVSRSSQYWGATMVEGDVEPAALLRCSLWLLAPLCCSPSPVLLLDSVSMWRGKN